MMRSSPFVAACAECCICTGGGTAGAHFCSAAATARHAYIQHKTQSHIFYLSKWRVCAAAPRRQQTTHYKLIYVVRVHFCSNTVFFASTISCIYDDDDDTAGAVMFSFAACVLHTLSSSLAVRCGGTSLRVCGHGAHSRCDATHTHTHKKHTACSICKLCTNLRIYYDVGGGGGGTKTCSILSALSHHICVCIII